MKSLFYISIIFIFSGQIGCAQTTEKAFQYWLDENYIKCLEKNLPCECENLINGIYHIAIDSSNSKKYSLVTSRSKQLEPEFSMLVNNGGKNFDILKVKSGNVLGVIKYSGENLVLSVNGVESTFSMIGASDLYDLSSLSRENITIVNKELKKRGYPILEEILQNENLTMSCNNWLKGVNLVSVKGKPLSWVLKVEDDKLLIFEVTNQTESYETPMVLNKIKEMDWM